MTANINTPGITPANTKPTIDASFLCRQFGCSTSLWSKGDVTRVYVNKSRNKCYGYVEFHGETVTAVDSLTTNVTNLCEVLAGELVATVAAPKFAERMARDWDNLQNEGCTDGYNPYRAPRTDYRDHARMMAAEGGDC